MWSAQRDGRIEFEVTRRDGSKCHEGAINQLVAYEEETLFTIGKSILDTFGSTVQLVHKLSVLNQCQVPTGGSACGT